MLLLRGACFKNCYLTVLETHKKINAGVVGCSVGITCSEDGGLAPAPAPNMGSFASFISFSEEMSHN